MAYMRGVFAKHPELLTEMLLLRMQGWSRYSLAKKFNTDKTTVRHWCDRTFKIVPKVTQGLAPERQETLIDFKPNTGKQYKYQNLFDEEDNVPSVGKTYVQIRVQARKRELIRLGTLRND